MLRSIVSSLATEKQKRFLRKRANAARNWWVNAFFRYDGEALKAGLRSMGIEAADTLLVHANFPPDSGFQGTPHDLVTALIELVGEQGTLMMVSQPFRGYAYDHLALNKTFDVRKTVSMMGLVTEMFRRTSGTVRSLHPTHPVLAYGKNSQSIVADHEKCLFPCGSGTPFEKFRKLDGKILFFDVGSGANTFFHHVEDILKDRLSFPIYDERLFSIRVIDANGEARIVRTYAFAKGVTRRTDMLERELIRRGKLSRKRIGNSNLILVRARDMVAVMTEMVESGLPLLAPAAR